MLPVPIRVTLLVIDALEYLDVPYIIAGSLASSVHGLARSTNDSDLVADLQVRHARPLVERLQADFYADEQAILSAIQNQSSFNVIHLETMFKVDVFVPRYRNFDFLQLARRQPYTLPSDPPRTIFVASPEDTILAKLEWYRMGGEVSDRQWRDVLGIRSIQGKRLDEEYIRKMASELRLTDLVERLFSES